MDIMALRVIGKTIRNFFLAVMEYGFKVSAFLGACVAMGSGPSFLDKIIAGCTSLAAITPTLPDAYERAVEAGEVFQDYNSLNQAAFTKLHGPSAIDGVMSTLNNAGLYFYGINQNISEAPLSTIGAAVIVFSMFFMAGWMLRIVRQGGEDLLLARLEKKLWTMLFKEDSQKTVDDESNEHESASQIDEPEEEGTIPELEVEEHWNEAKEHEERGHLLEAGKNTELELINKPEENLVEFESSSKTNGDVKEFDESSEKSVPQNEHEEPEESHLKLWEDTDDTSESDEFDLESELQPAAKEDKVQHEDNGVDALAEHEQKRTNGDTNTEDPKNESRASKKSSLTEKINKAKKSKKHSLEEFLDLARSS